MTKLQNFFAASLLALSAQAALATEAEAEATNTATVPVTVKNYVRAESDMYFARAALKMGAFGKFYHFREPTPIDNQTIIAMNRDTLYSGAIFDLDAGPVTIELPDTQGRFMSLMAISQDHYMPLLGYAPGRYTLTRELIGTRYVMAALRTMMRATDPADVKIATKFQDQVKVTQADRGRFEMPNWDSVSLAKVREPLLVLQGMSGWTNERRAGRNKDDVDPVQYLLAAAANWGLNPPEGAVYDNVQPALNDGNTVHMLTVKDVPVDAFWSISVYNEKFYFEKNPLDSYSTNSLSAARNQDGSVSIQFGGCTEKSANCLYTPPNWRYQVRLYRPRTEVINGRWVFPKAEPVKLNAH